MTALNTNGESAEQTKQRISVLTDVIKRRRSLSECQVLLSEFAWDSAPLVAVTADDSSAVLRSFIAAEMSAGSVEGWAETIEVRDDVYFDEPQSARAIFVLANPALEGELSTALAQEILALLRR